MKTQIKKQTVNPIHQSWLQYFALNKRFEWDPDEEKASISQKDDDPDHETEIKS